ncbi:hypothetical protein DEH18_33780 [Streptomyces sp. NHF165]|uniref:hypothetical protein n=1 Tax=Streptomyces TaxID=1883 RepID=UPI00132E85BA|nr:hypothetical protein [Streptomyces sp. NHF165]QHF97984.1 hypothetical protein DEH18_33780 [Streptomyces sp. NHF165]
MSTAPAPPGSPVPGPDTPVYLRVRDVDGPAREFGVRVEEVPWAREIELRDPDGNRLRIGAPPTTDAGGAV